MMSSSVMLLVGLLACAPPPRQRNERARVEDGGDAVRRGLRLEELLE
jgi:hypothetical protein